MDFVFHFLMRFIIKGSDSIKIYLSDILVMGYVSFRFFVSPSLYFPIQVLLPSSTDSFPDVSSRFAYLSLSDFTIWFCDVTLEIGSLRGIIGFVYTLVKERFVDGVVTFVVRMGG